MNTDIISKEPILTAAVASRKLRRMAFQIAENNIGEEKLIIAGITGNGVLLAKALVEELKQIIPIPIQLITITLNKKQPLDVSIDEGDYNNTVLILVDDVANTGKTLLYALKPFMNYLPKKIQTLVLVERSHKLFPVQADYVGLSVSTTLQEHITVETDGGTITGAWLH
ncbi:MAG TPA: phosphoribosyltransferase family protein [Chitinophagaceae bacterium]|nr:phosphoribosyltransferase family protein [Chitinophagaceae bacterium]